MMRGLRRTGVIALFVLAGTAAAALVLARGYHLGVAATAVAIIIGLPALFVAWVSYGATQQAATGAAITKTTLAAAADELARAVRDQWAEEAAARHLDDPGLRVSLLPAEQFLAEKWSALVGLATSGAGWPPSPPATTWAAGPDELAADGSDVASLLARIPTRRLAVLGEAGAGKTMLLIRLVLDLLARRADGDPVPILLSLSDWNPAREELRGWLAARMTLDHPALAVQASSGGTDRTLAEALLAEGLITPVLDGLDEIPDRLRGAAIVQINRALRPGESMAVSSRTAAYEATVRPRRGTPGTTSVRLRGTAVVKLGSVQPDMARDYLLRDVDDPAAWTQVVKALGTSEAAGQALTTPLMLSLAREIYNPSPAGYAAELPDPAELCDSVMDSREAVERHLLDAFIPAAYRPRPGRAGRCDWSASQARRYLAFLASYLERQTSGTDLAWWILSGPGATPAQGLRWSQRGFRSKLMLAPASGLVVATGFVLAGKPAVGLGGGLACALVCGIGAGLQSAPANLTVAPSPRMTLARDRSTFLAYGLLAGPLIGLAVGLIMGLATPGGVLAAGSQTGLVTGLVVGPIAWLVFTLLFGWVTGLVFGLIIGTADWLVSWLLGHHLHNGLIIQAISGTLMGVVVGLLFGAVKTTWPKFVITRYWLAIRGYLPWQLMRFLADAHRRGVLRQAGAVYQFRHAELQRSLAARR
jgi:hypothetical protein